MFYTNFTIKYLSSDLISIEPKQYKVVIVQKLYLRPFLPLPGFDFLATTGLLFLATTAADFLAAGFLAAAALGFLAGGAARD